MREVKIPNLNWENKLILVAEDDYHCCELIKEILKITNCNVIHTSDGKSTFIHCIKNPCIDLVLLDIKLPRLNGLDTAHLIKKYRPNIPIIAQTAHALVIDRDKCLQFGCDDYLAKPFSFVHLLTKMSYYLDDPGINKEVENFVLN